MLKFISNYPISRRLIVAFTLAALFPSVIFSLVGFYYVNQMSGRGSASAIMIDAQNQTDSLASALQHTYTETRSLESQVLSVTLVPSDHTARTAATQTASQAATDISQLGKQFSNYQSQYDPLQSANMRPVYAMLNSISQNNDAPQVESNLLNTIITQSWPAYRTAQQAEASFLQQVLNSPDGSFTPQHIVSQITSDSNQLTAAYNTLNSNWGLVMANVNQMSKTISAETSGDMQPVMVGTIGAILLVIFLVITSGVLVQKSITGPLSELVSLTRRISKGDTRARAQVTSHDEFAIVATAMNNMMDNIVHLIQNTQAQRDMLQGQVEKLVAEVSGVGEGDLRIKAEVTADALGVLADSFNYMVEELGSLVVRVKSVANEVEASTTMTSDRMTELVETADRQIQQIANAAFEIERMALASQQVASRATALASSARQARSNAQGGRLAVQQAIEGMGRIHSNVQETSSKVQTLGERSREINNIVEAISSIAHQTNRLALDAAIQAAMAGENGKGFGAVATDIRRQAERAKEQATSVGRIVRSVRDDIGAVAVAMRDTERESDAGAKLAEEAGASLGSIFAVIEQPAREIDVINQMATQQQQTSNHVVQIMQGVSASTQISANSTREAAQNMERVARLAEQLLASVEAFKLRDTMSYLTSNTHHISDPIGEETGIPPMAGGIARTVTSTAQPISSGGSYNPEMASSGGSGFPLYAGPYMPGNTNDQQLFLPQGNGKSSGLSSLPPLDSQSGQQPFASRNYGSGPGRLPAQENESTQAQRPIAGEWNRPPEHWGQV